MALRNTVFALLFVTAAGLHLERFISTMPIAVGGGVKGIDLATFTQLEFQAKYALGMEGLLPATAQSPHQRTMLRKAIRQMLASLASRQTYRALTTRQLGILCATFDESKQAQRRFDRAAKLSHDPDERALWRSIYGSQPLTKNDLPRVKAKLREYHLDWYEHLVLEAAARKAGDTALAAREQQLMISPARRVGLLVLLFGFAILGLGLLGLAGTVLAIVFAALGQLRFGALSGSKLPARPLLETWALYFFLMEVTPVLPWQRFFTSRLTAGLMAEAVTLLSLFYLWKQLKAANLTWAEIGWKRPQRLDPVWGLAGEITAVPWVLGSALVMFALCKAVFKDVTLPTHPINEILTRSHSTITIAIIFVLAVIVAPLVEETFFRGILHGAIRRRYGPWAGIVGSSFIFAALHPQLPLGFPSLFLLGATFAILYELRGTLIPGMVAHAANNGVALLVTMGLFR